MSDFFELKFVLVHTSAGNLVVECGIVIGHEEDAHLIFGAHVDGHPIGESDFDQQLVLVVHATLQVLISIDCWLDGLLTFGIIFQR